MSKPMSCLVGGPGSLPSKKMMPVSCLKVDGFCLARQFKECVYLVGGHI
jgi:hypothetical protein